MIVWTSDNVEYKGYTLNQVVLYKEYSDDVGYKTGRIIGFNLDEKIIYSVYIEQDIFGTSFEERRCFIEKSPCIFTNKINPATCKFTCVALDKIKSSESFTIKELKNTISTLPDDYEVCIDIGGLNLSIKDIVSANNIKTLKIIGGK